MANWRSSSRSTRSGKKFRARYGLDALRFIGAQARKHLQMREINATVVAAGVVRLGDAIRKR